MVPMTAALPALALAVGGVLGLGLWVAVAAMPRFGRPSLTDRVAPMLLDVSPLARALIARRSADPLPVLGLVIGPVVSPIRRALVAATGGDDLERTLRRAGMRVTAAEYRSRRAVWCVAGAVLGALVGTAAAIGQGGFTMLSPALLVLGGVGAALVHARMLQRNARRTAAVVAEELPTMLEFLALSLSAGEGMRDAVTRLARLSHGELARRLRLAIAEASTGVPLIDALDRVATDLGLPAFTRLVQQLRAALERGTPLAEVLHAQASDAREAAKRELLERAGKREIAMLVPVVFLILPVTVLFVVYPGLAVLRIGF